jgi:hypothetical protein
MAIAGDDLFGRAARGARRRASTAPAALPGSDETTAPRPQRQVPAAVLRGLFAAVVAAGAGAAFLLASPAAPARLDDPQLGTLLRAMGGVKLVLAAVAGAGVWWRLGQRITLPFAAAYAGGVSLLALAALLLLQLSHLAQAAAVFHGAAFATFALALQDRDLSRHVLPDLIASRRAPRGVPPQY